jgi:hypothetical protein
MNSDERAGNDAAQLLTLALLKEHGPLTISDTTLQDVDEHMHLIEQDYDMATGVTTLRVVDQDGFREEARAGTDWPNPWDFQTITPSDEFGLATEEEEEEWRRQDVLHEDPVNHPSHYKSDSGIECIEAIRAALGHEGFVAYCRGNAMKYQWRCGDKGKPAEDLRKSAWYSNASADAIDGGSR